MAAALVVLAGCMSAGGSPTDAGAPMGQRYQDVVALARSSGVASQEQLTVLESATSSGALTFAAYSEAIDETIACMKDAGIAVTGPIADNTWGYPRLTYIAQTGIMDVTSGGATDGDFEEHVSATPEVEDVDPQTRVADACRERNSMYVEYAYDSQPSTIQAYDAVLATKRKAVAACGHEVGIDPDPSLPIREFLMEFTDSDEGRNCLQEAEVYAL